MKKIAILVAMVSMMGLSACANKASTASAATSVSTETASTATAATSVSSVAEFTEKTYSVKTNNFETWDYSFCNINAFGDTAGVGMLNVQSWGNKKLKLGDDGTCDGVGCSWTITLDLTSETAYVLKTTAHLVGNGTAYGGEGDFTYEFDGAYTGTTDYVLTRPTAVKVTLAEGFNRLTDGSDFADYIPSGPWEINSTIADDDAAVVAVKKKIVPSYLISTVFGGATFKVDGTAIASVTDIDFTKNI